METTARIVSLRELAGFWLSRHRKAVTVDSRRERRTCPQIVYRSVVTFVLRQQENASIVVLTKNTDEKPITANVRS